MPVGLSDLTETEQDLLSHLQNGYQLETDSLGQEPMLRHTEDNQVMRSLSATRNTVPKEWRATSLGDSPAVG